VVNSLETFQAAVTALCDKVTVATLNKLLKKCGITQQGTKCEKMTTMALWKAGL
jgi:hypothetical protein